MYGSPFIFCAQWYRPCCKWSDDEKWMVRTTSNEIVLYNGTQPARPSHRMRLENVADISLAPGAAPNGKHYISAFVPENKVSCLNFFYFFYFCCCIESLHFHLHWQKKI
jgi:uncharacterized protein with WD repeat